MKPQGREYDLHAASRLVDALFQRSRGTETSPLVRNLKKSGEEVLPGILYRFEMVNNNSGKPVLMQLYCGLGDIGGQLWEQEARALLHLSNLEHPGLPKIVEGGFFEEEGVGYVVTDGVYNTLATKNAMAAFRKPPHGFTRALRQLMVLADALSRLHARGMMHRGIGPAALEIFTPLTEAGDGMDLRLSRFEMSVLISNLARRLRGTQQGRLETIRNLYLRAGLQSLLCCPPERLALLYRGDETHGRSPLSDTYEEANSDVYGLGILAYQWFVELIPDERLTPIFNEQSLDREALRALQAEMGRKIRAQTDLPTMLKELLQQMIEPSRRQRATSADVVKQLAEHASATITDVPATMLDRPFVISIMPTEFQKTMNDLGHVTAAANSDVGWQEIKSFLEEDLKGGLMSYSAAGFTPFRKSPDPELAKAKYVLRGTACAYFARLHEQPDPEDPYGGQMQEVPQVLRIRQVLILSRPEARFLSKTLHKRRMPRFELIRSEMVEHSGMEDRPSWVPLLQATEVDFTVPSWLPAFQQAMNFILEVQDVQAQARRYYFKRHPSSKGNESKVTLLLDRSRDQKHLDSKSLLHLYARVGTNRPPFGDFFEQIDSSRESGVVISAEQTSASTIPERGIAFFVRKNNPEEIEIQRRSDAPPVPESGWIQPAEDTGMSEASARQREAVSELFENDELMGQLHEPRALARLRNTSPEVGKNLLGNAQKIVSEMLDYVPFYAIHGPPGTGKTTVTAHAVEATLRQDRSQRILVSAQSHESLDNIAERILKPFAQGKGKGDVLAVRVATASSVARVSPNMQLHLPQRLAEARVRDIVDTCGERLESGWLPESIRKLAEGSDAKQAQASAAIIRRVLGQWRAHADASTLEIKDRLRRGANLVFATCLTATGYYLAAETNRDLFDWVIIEEAAKAWPTELAIPLVRGIKWTLLGDHHQLPAFGRQEMEALLDACEASPDEKVKRHHEHRFAYLDVFDLFRNLFKPRKYEATPGAKDGPAKAAPPAVSRSSGLLRRPLGELDIQFRMKQPIAELVKVLFYKKLTLDTDSSTDVDHGLSSPAALRGKCLVFCDTDQVEGCEEVFRKNPGEARVINNLLNELKPNPILYAEGARSDRLEILTPYNDQITQLKQTLPSVYHAYISTIDSFQGKEADIVIVSLVRDNQKDTPAKRIGHLRDAQRVNVMLSRARRLLILVGNCRHFEQTKEQAEYSLWPDLISNLRRLGHVMKASDLVEAPSRVQWATSLKEAAERHARNREDR